jgi:hypothetical protein
MKKCAVFFAFLLLSIVYSGHSLAEHAVPFRFTVLGYVKEQDGKVRPGVEVRVTREKTGLSYVGATDRTGLYVIVTRLVDENMGEALSLRTAEQAVRIVARFDPSDHEHERGTRVDFVGAKHVELPAAFADTLGRFLAQ